MKKSKYKHPLKQKTGLNGALNYFAERIISKKSASISHLKFRSVKHLKPYLIDKRGSRISENFKCALCGNIYSRGWRYKVDENTHILLCQDCKEAAKPSRTIKTIVSTPMK